MALFGDLAHHAFTDLAKVLRPQTGSLYLHEAYQGRTLELTLMRGQLLALYVDGFPVPTPTQAGDILRAVSARPQGEFEFQARVLTSAEPTLYVVPLLETLQTFTATAVPEEQLPHPETRFQASATSAPVPASLQARWTSLAPHLRQGASAAELSRLTGQAERDLRVTLHHLRAAELVTPVRRVGVTDAHAPALPVWELTPTAGAGAAAPAPLISRLLGALRRLTGARA
ncbi:hypothetical protein GCM10008956_00720 [Deinococcus arenae]|uniref:DUF4388 domain-containing protein n=1 Tax=Deinococcus arenae TaxID=1452751 RepID=A0A8H9L4X0_9DEIO|nr:hypothetical protein [Deinococcus arenae]AWT36171.1 hypothetical protein DM785_11830 [Deinococcus actinosclerus]GGM28607.1 hypothetical protein GCM10008956_00720 [Deinococcus arenae]